MALKYLDHGTSIERIADKTFFVAREGSPQYDAFIIERDADPSIVEPASNHVPVTFLKNLALEEIDAAAESARLKYITSGFGQALTYQEKADEARRYLAEPGDPEDFPFLAAEAEAIGGTLTEAASYILETRAAWVSIASAIEGLRRKAKELIKMQETAFSINSVAQSYLFQIKEV